MRTDCELELLDADRQPLYLRNFAVSLNRGGPGAGDASLSLDRKTLRTLRYFELRGRTECAAIARLAIDELP